MKKAAVTRRPDANPRSRGPRQIQTAFEEPAARGAGGVWVPSAGGIGARPGPQSRGALRAEVPAPQRGVEERDPPRDPHFAMVLAFTVPFVPAGAALWLFLPMPVQSWQHVLFVLVGRFLFFGGLWVGTFGECVFSGQCLGFQRLGCPSGGRAPSGYQGPHTLVGHPRHLAASKKAYKFPALLRSPLYAMQRGP
jgi:hypothetical protein